MQNGRTTPRHFKPGPAPVSRAKRWTPRTVLETRNEATGDILSLPKKSPGPATKLFPGPDSIS
jgi:hypothetical protein